jgi:hypothetical protein
MVCILQYHAVRRSFILAEFALQQPFNHGSKLFGGKPLPPFLNNSCKSTQKDASVMELMPACYRKNLPKKRAF